MKQFERTVMVIMATLVLASCASTGSGSVDVGPSTHTIMWTAPEPQATPYEFKFVPHVLTVVAGDSVRFTVGSGWPHMVKFLTDSLSPAAIAHIRAEFQRIDPKLASWLASPEFQRLNPTAASMLASRFYRHPGSGFTLSTAGWPPGEYRFLCGVHAFGGEVGRLHITPRDR